MTELLESSIGSFRETFGGTVLTPGEHDYDSARSLWNGAIDHRPAIIAHCRGNADVVAALRFARDQGLEISVRGGGFWERLRPHASGGAYVNFMAEYDEERVRATYGAQKYERLARIKARYDPDNVFHRGVNIKPQP